MATSPTIPTRLPHGTRKPGQRSGDHFGADGFDRPADGVLVVDDEAEVTVVLVRSRRWPLHQRQELVVQIDEGSTHALAASLEREERARDPKGPIDISDLQRDVVDCDRARFRRLARGRYHGWPAEDAYVGVCRRLRLRDFGR